MATEVIVPRMGWSMEEGTFQEWLKRDGERVEVGDMLFVMEGNKTAQEVESFDAGYLRLPPDAPKPGDAVVVGQRLAFLADEDDLEPWKDAPQPGAVPGRKTPVGKAPAPATSLTGKTVPLSATRKAIALQMVAGANLTAPVTLHREVDATALVALRRQFKQACDDKKTVPTYNDILIRLVAEVLKSHPQLNSQWREEGVLFDFLTGTIRNWVK